VLHQGRGDLDTVTGASLVRSHDRVRSEPYRLQVGMIGLEAMLRLFTEQEANEKAFTALTRFLDALDEAPLRPGSRAAHDPVVLSFQLKLLWVSGYMPHLETCVECGCTDPLVAFLPSAGGGACAACDPGGIPLSLEGVHGMRVLLHSPIAAASGAGLTDRALRDTLAVVTASYEHHGGFRLRTVAVS
jgi:DNA repair protein RecO